jgi:hypothetical protein
MATKIKKRLKRNEMKFIKEFSVIGAINYEFDYSGIVLNFDHYGNLWYHSNGVLSEEQRIEIISEMQIFKHIFANEIIISDKFTGAREFVKQRTFFSSKIVVKTYRGITTISCRNFLGSINEFEDYIKNESYLRLEFYKVQIKDIRNNIAFFELLDKHKTL